MRIRPARRLALLTLSLSVAAAATVMVQQRTADVTFTGHVVKPQRLGPPAVGALKVPPGFTVSVFAEGLGKPRMLAVADDGTVFVTRRDPGDVVMLRDADRDGRAETSRVAVRRPKLHGIALSGRRAYLVGVDDLFVADIQPDGTFANVQRLVDDLPDSGQHPNRTIAIGPDGGLYVSVGSTCNECDESSPESAALLQVSPDGRSRRIFASGLRNTIGFDWHPDTGVLFGMDHGIDWFGDDQQEEELNRLERGRQYGWPYVYGKGQLNPQDEPPGEVTSEEWARLSQPPVLTYTAHAAPMQMAFYTGAMLPAEYHGDAFVAMHGSWNRKQPSGYEVVRVRFNGGEPAAFEPFLTGFLTTTGGKPTMTGRPVGIAVAMDGALLVSDDLNGRIYRITHAGGGAGASSTSARSSAPAARTVRDPGSEGDGTLALARPETESSGRLTVTSPAFTAGGRMPTPYTGYGERFSPALAWSGAPAGTRSFALFVEDPDARTPRPYVHWLLYDVPPGTTRLAESIPGVLRLPAPKGAMQGQTSRGQIGYVGPQPPPGDTPHHYHFQLFALDTMLALKPGATRDELLAAMRGHVLARGELVGTFQHANAR